MRRIVLIPLELMNQLAEKGNAPHEVAGHRVVIAIGHLTGDTPLEAKLDFN